MYNTSHPSYVPVAYLGKSKIGSISSLYRFIQDHSSMLIFSYHEP